MAKKILISQLADFYKSQQEQLELDSSYCDESDIVRSIAKRKSPGVVIARANGIPFTVAKGTSILSVLDDNSSVCIGEIARKDVKIEIRQYVIK